MAGRAMDDQKKRTIQVNTKDLIKTLKWNREKHIQDFEESLAGYKDLLLTKLDSAFERALSTVSEKHEKTKAMVAGLSDEDIAAQGDYFTLIEDVTVQMKVPRSFVKEYDAAIAMAEWDVRETLELTNSEFTCFVRDEWDWKSGFDSISTHYKRLR